MSSEENKLVVSRFIAEVLSGGNVAAVDELVSPRYANPRIGARDRDAYKGFLTGLMSALPTREFEVEDLVADGDSVVFRGNMHVTLASGKKISARMITFYRLANGMIVEDEPISTPPLRDLLGGMTPPKPSS